MKKSLTLFELNALVRETLALQMPDEYWVEAELSEAREVRGHCYMELIQKDDRSNTPVAKASAKCWASTWQLVKPHFMRVTGQQVHAGMKVLLKVYAQFHESYGFSWIVTDIDPTYTLGDMARKRLEIIRQLKEEGVFDLQKELLLPMFCQRIAVISSANAAGYGDFVNQLESNEYGFRFHTQLFPAIMQGEGVEQSVIAALNKIFERFGTDLRGKTFALWGLAFKPQTDDMRESPAIEVVHDLVGAGAVIKAYDPQAFVQAHLYLSDIPEDHISYIDDQYAVTRQADALILLTEWKQFRSPDFNYLKSNLKNPVIVDGRNQYDGNALKQEGFDYYCVGRTF